MDLTMDTTYTSQFAFVVHVQVLGNVDEMTSLDVDLRSLLWFIAVH